MPYELCRHVMSSGSRCSSPALKEKDWCFFHHRLHDRYTLVHHSDRVMSPTPLLIPTLEDAESIQVGITLVIEAIAYGRIDEKRGALLIRGLQCAARNVRNLRPPPPPEQIVNTYCPNLTGFALAGRQMSDNSEPPPRPPRIPYVEPNPPAK